MQVVSERKLHMQVVSERKLHMQVVSERGNCTCKLLVREETVRSCWW